MTNYWPKQSDDSPKPTAADVATMVSHMTELDVTPSDVDEPEPGYFEIDGMPFRQWADAMMMGDNA